MLREELKREEVKTEEFRDRRSSVRFERLFFVGSNIDLAAAVDTRIAGVVGASIDGSAAAAISHAASKVGTASIDGGRIRRHVEVRSNRVEVRIRNG